MHACGHNGQTSINILETFQRGHVKRQTTIHTLAPVANLMFLICLMWMFFVCFFLLWEEVVEKHQKTPHKKGPGNFLPSDKARFGAIG